jgi:hypothetical protein
MPSSLKTLRCEINSGLIGIIWRQYIYEHSGVCRVIYVTLFSQALLDDNIKCTEFQPEYLPFPLCLSTNVSFFSHYYIYYKSWGTIEFTDFTKFRRLPFAMFEIIITEKSSSYFTQFLRICSLRLTALTAI